MRFRFDFFLFSLYTEALNLDLPNILLIVLSGFIFVVFISYYVSGFGIITAK